MSELPIRGVGELASGFVVTGAEETQDVDAVVVGGGILGLVVAKHLVDFGQRVALVEQSHAIADGPSIKNHGWLHTGLAHSLSVEDPIAGKELVAKLQFGHRFFTSYAPECLNEPSQPTYAIAQDPELAHRARMNWTNFGVPFKELSYNHFFEVEPGLDPSQASFFFEGTDSRINNRLLFAKLLTDIRRGGALALLGASYEYEDDQTMYVSTDDDATRLRSPLFFYTTGAGLDESHQKLTGESLGIEFWKSHLLLLPRITAESIVSLDRNTPIVINHGSVSIVNRSYDENPAAGDDTTVDLEEVERAFEALSTYYPRATDY